MIARILATLLLLAPAVRGQQPDPPRVDPDVIPAQFTRPVAAEPTPPVPMTNVADPPTPVVRIQVRVPAHTAPTKDVTYKLIVTNTSSADAYRVAVRNPVPAGVAQVISTEPKADRTDPGAPGGAPKELGWNLGTLRAGEKREIDLVFRPTPDAKEISNQAFVGFEHGQRVTTRIDKPKLAVTKVAPQKAATGDKIPVRVEVTNTGRVPIAAVELIEDVTKGFEFAADPESEKTANPQQRLWKLGTLRPGERRVIEYRLTAREAADLLAQSVVKSGDAPDSTERAESTTKVQSAGLTMELTGPAAVNGGEPALYTIKVTNTGTLPLSDIKVSANVPTDTTVSRMTNGGERYRNEIVWRVPDGRDGPLKAGESYTVRFGLKATTGGPRTIRAAADAGRGLEKAQELRTNFDGTALLQWTAAPDVPALTVGRSGLLTIKISNQGGDAARNVRLRIQLPAGVKFVEASPRHQASANQVTFDAITVPANSVEKFSLTYEAVKAGQAWFDLKLTADSLGDHPLTKEQAIEITGGR